MLPPRGNPLNCLKIHIAYCCHSMQDGYEPAPRKLPPPPGLIGQAPP